MMTRNRFRRMLIADRLIRTTFRQPVRTKLERLTGHDYRHFQPVTLELNRAYIALVEGEVEGKYIKPVGETRWCLKTWYGYVPLFEY